MSSYPYLQSGEPNYTFTVSKTQTAARTADIIAHTFENYFQHQEAFIQERSSRGHPVLLHPLFAGGLANPDDYGGPGQLYVGFNHGPQRLTSKGRAGA